MVTTIANFGLDRSFSPFAACCECTLRGNVEPVAARAAQMCRRLIWVPSSSILCGAPAEPRKTGVSAGPGLRWRLGATSGGWFDPSAPAVFDSSKSDFYATETGGPVPGAAAGTEPNRNQPCVFRWWRLGPILAQMSRPRRRGKTFRQGLTAGLHSPWYRAQAARLAARRGERPRALLDQARELRRDCARRRPAMLPPAAARCLPCNPRRLGPALDCIPGAGPLAACRVRSINVARDQCRAAEMPPPGSGANSGAKSYDAAAAHLSCGNLVRLVGQGTFPPVWGASASGGAMSF